jgi:hypothetical protein
MRHPWGTKRRTDSHDTAAAAHRVVIVGGGLRAAKLLAGTPAQVTLVDRTNRLLFQPLLYQGEVGARPLSAGSDVGSGFSACLRCDRSVEPPAAPYLGRYHIAEPTAVASTITPSGISTSVQIPPTNSPQPEQNQHDREHVEPHRAPSTRPAKEQTLTVRPRQPAGNPVSTYGRIHGLELETADAERNAA